MFPEWNFISYFYVLWLPRSLLMLVTTATNHFRQYCNVLEIPASSFHFSSRLPPELIHIWCLLILKYSDVFASPLNFLHPDRRIYEMLETQTRAGGPILFAAWWHCKCHTEQECTTNVSIHNLCQTASSMKTPLSLYMWTTCRQLSHSPFSSWAIEHCLSQICQCLIARCVYQTFTFHMLW